MQEGTTAPYCAQGPVCHNGTKLYVQATEYVTQVLRAAASLVSRAGHVISNARKVTDLCAQIMVHATKMPIPHSASVMTPIEVPHAKCAVQLMTLATLATIMVNAMWTQNVIVFEATWVPVVKLVARGAL